SKGRKSGNKKKKDFDVGDGDCESAGVYDSPINGQIRELPIAVKGENQAVEIEVKKAAFFKRFNDLELPYGYQFLALDMKFSNILAAQEVITYPDGGNHPSSWINGGAAAGGKKTIQVPQYLIPDLSSHLFLNCNNGNMYPASPVTWLSETPLINPGEFDLTVLAEAAAEGVSIFVVPDQAMEQLSLHFYDTAYGHIVIPLVGDVDIEELELEVLPQGEPVRLSEAFSIVPAAVKDIEEIAGIRAADWDSVFRVVEAELTSNVQALLDINPEQVFSLSISTKKGDYFVPLNPITENLPMGFVRKTMIAPGSFNKVRLAFQVPYALAEEECSLYVNMKKDDVIIPLEKTIDGEGFVDEINTCEEISNDISSYKGEGIELIVNQILSCSEVMNLYNNWLVADVTLLDYSDGFETALYDGLKLVREKTEEGQESQSPYIYVESTGLGSFGDHSEVSDILIPAEVSGDLLLGISNETVIIDGTTRRGFVLFEIPETGLEYNWSLQSALFPEMNIPVQIAVEDEEGNKVFSISENNIEEEMLVASTFYNEAMREYNEKLDQALQEAVVRYQALQAAGNNITLKKRIDLNAERMSDPAPVPQLSLSGVVELSQISSIENFRVTMEGIRWLPSKDNIWQYRYAPEAVLTQGWGTENDLAILAERILKQLGYITEKQTVVVTEEGYHSLRELGQVASLEERYLPALGYRDEDGNNCLFVLPFMKDISELRGLVRLPETTGDVYPEPKNINLIVSLRVESTDQGVNTRFSDMSSALAGEGEELQYQEIQVFSEYLPLDTLSLDAIDLGYTVVGREYGDLITVVVETSTDKVIGQEHVDTGLYRITGAKIELALPDDHVSHQVFLEEEDSIDGIFHTLAINLPDISSNAMSELQNTADNTYNKVEQPDLVSALRWYTRNIINRFIFGQSEFENDLAEKLDLNIGRTRNPRCLIVTVKKSTGGNEGASMENGIETSIDLMRAENETHYGEKTAREAFNILSGIFASKLEAEVLPGKHQGLFEIWQQLPEETDFVWIFPDNKGEALSIMEQCNWPERIRNLIAETEDVIFTPTIPALIDGEERWAWLKINPYDYRTIAVLDTGERGAAVEYSIGISEDTAGQFFVASFIGLDISIWSVACFSLKLDNYEQILDQAEKMARGLGQRLFSVDLVDEDIEGDGDGAGNVKASMGIGGGKPSLSYYGITVDYNPGLWRGTFKFSKGLIDGFSKGYETAIDLYFGAAREGNSSSGDNSQGNHGGRGNGDEGGPGGE
ncbi:MAG: hypothetical protein ACLFUI_01750, partial [Halanaerobiales bacterium]